MKLIKFHQANRKNQGNKPNCPFETHYFLNFPICHIMARKPGLAKVLVNGNCWILCTQISSLSCAFVFQ